VSDLAHWLAGLGLGKYAEVLAAQEIDFDLLSSLTEADVRELGFRSVRGANYSTQSSA
jgi:hypothetical protein